LNVAEKNVEGCAAWRPTAVAISITRRLARPSGARPSYHGVCRGNKAGCTPNTRDWGIFLDGCVIAPPGLRSSRLSHSADGAALVARRQGSGRYRRSPPSLSAEAPQLGRLSPAHFQKTIELSSQAVTDRG